MKSYDVKDHGVSDQILGQAKKPWVTPSLDIIALKSAESGANPRKNDRAGGRYKKPVSGS